MLNGNNYISIYIRRETVLNDIRGRIIYISAEYYEDNKLVDSFYGRYLKPNEIISGHIDTIEKLRPVDVDRITHPDYHSMVIDFFNFYCKHKMGAIIITSSMPCDLPELYNYVTDGGFLECDPIYYPYPIIDTLSLGEILSMYGPDVTDNVYKLDNLPVTLHNIHENMINVYQFFKPNGGIGHDATNQVDLSRH